jgi:hypothetical protein
MEFSKKNLKKEESSDNNNITQSQEQYSCMKQQLAENQEKLSELRNEISIEASIKEKIKKSIEEKEGNKKTLLEVRDKLVQEVFVIY